MTAVSGSLRLRPTRIGFLVDPADTESLRRIFQVCTCSWGGVFNPIIPVCSLIPEIWTNPPFTAPSPIELAQGYNRFFEPDVYVEAHPGLAERIGLTQTDFGFGHSRIIPLDSYFAADGPFPLSMPFGIESLDIYKAVYEREFKFVSRHEHRVALFSDTPSVSPFIEAAFGGFPLAGPLQSSSRAYMDAFDPVVLVPNPENWIKVIKEGFLLPLSFTMENLKRDRGGWTEPTLFVVDSGSSHDLIDLWNIRQFHPQILPVNLSWLRDTKELLTEFLSAHSRHHVGDPNEQTIPVTIRFGRSVISGNDEKTFERGRAILSEAGITYQSDAPWSMKFSYDEIWAAGQDTLSNRPQRAEITAATTDLELNIEDEGPGLSCRFATLSPEFGRTYGTPSEARWVNVLKLRSYGTNDSIALTLPSSFSLQSARGLRIGSPTFISREGFVLPQEYKHHREYFRLMKGRDAVIDWLKQHDIEAQPSESGRIAEQVLSSLGGFWGTNTVADRETVKLLDEMSKSVRKHPDGKIEEFPERSVDVKRWRDLINRRSNTWHQSVQGGNLDAFIKARIFKLGLVLTCTNCLKKNWYGIENLKEELTCERCLKPYPFPQGTLNFDQAPWHYRVVGPYSVPNFADGAYSTVLALAVFAVRLGGNRTKLTYATGLNAKLPGGDSFEVDFTFWYQRDNMFGLDEEPELVFGEAKSFAVESFKADDISRMRKLAGKFPGAFIVFATLKDELSATEKDLIGQFAILGREELTNGRPRTPVIVLTGTELFCGWQVEAMWAELGGQRATAAARPPARFDDLLTLANLTQQIYLGLPDPRLRPRPPLSEPSPMR